jgi:hypothetical protein
MVSITSSPISKILGSSCFIAQIKQLNIVLNYSGGIENKTKNLVKNVTIKCMFNNDFQEGKEIHSVIRITIEVLSDHY